MWWMLRFDTFLWYISGIHYEYGEGAIAVYMINVDKYQLIYVEVQQRIKGLWKTSKDIFVKTAKLYIFGGQSVIFEHSNTLCDLIIMVCIFLLSIKIYIIIWYWWYLPILTQMMIMPISWNGWYVLCGIFVIALTCYLWILVIGSRCCHIFFDAILVQI